MCFQDLELNTVLKVYLQKPLAMMLKIQPLFMLSIILQQVCKYIIA